MSDPSLFRLRVKFVEEGRLAFLSHLEVAHTLERTVRRAQLPYAISQGFSPHMRIAFGAALPVGVGSTCEIFDLLLTRYVDPAEALDALQKASVSSLMPVSCAYIEPRAAAASVAFPFSTYELSFDAPLVEFSLPQTIEVVRKRKLKQLNVAEFVAEPLKLQGDKAYLTLEAKPTGSLRPDVLCENSSFSAHLISITRIKQRAEL